MPLTVSLLRDFHTRGEQSFDYLARRKTYRNDGYSRKLDGHKSCVNALTFSNGDGRWLASAGDGQSN